MNIITLIVIGALGIVLTSTITGIAVAIVKNIKAHHHHESGQKRIIH